MCAIVDFKVFSSDFAHFFCRWIYLKAKCQGKFGGFQQSNTHTHTPKRILRKAKRASVHLWYFWEGSLHSYMCPCWGSHPGRGRKEASGRSHAGQKGNKKARDLLAFLLPYSQPDRMLFCREDQWHTDLSMPQEAALIIQTKFKGNFSLAFAQQLEDMYRPLFIERAQI